MKTIHENISALFPVLPENLRCQMLERPSGRVNAILDTDTFNEIDDQFALSMAMLLPDVLNIQAVTAAPFLNRKVSTAEEGMEKSYQEILHVLELLGKSRDGFVFPGSRHFMQDPLTLVESPAARRIVELAKKAAAKDEILYVLAIGAITNVTSALLMAPEIIRNVVIVWLGGNNLNTMDNWEFNLKQDITAAQIIFDSGVPLVWIPCRGVAELLLTTLHDIEQRTADCGGIGSFLSARSREYMNNVPYALKVIWDISTVLYFARPDLVTSRLMPAPVLENNTTWHEYAGRHSIRQVTYLERTQCFNFMYDILKTAPK